MRCLLESKPELYKVLWLREGISFTRKQFTTGLVKSQLHDGGRCVGEAGIIFLSSILLPLASRVRFLSHHQHPDLLSQN